MVGLPDDWDVQAKDVASDQELNYMSSATAAILEQAPRGGRKLLLLMLTFFVLAILWAALAHVDEFTRGEGKVIPSRHVQIIQNLEGGILDDLFVREGQLVEQGQPLLRIDDRRFSSSLREARVTREQLLAEVSRLEAEINSRPFIMNFLEQGVPESVYRSELALYQSRQEEFMGQVEVLDQQLAQKEQELESLQAKQQQLARGVTLLLKELEMTEPLAAEGAISEVELLRLRRQVNDLEGELKGAELAIPRAQSAQAEVVEKLENIELTFRREAQQALTDTRLELSRLTQTSDALEDRVERTLVKSPVAGTVKRLLVKTLGGVIQPGMDIVEIIPTEDSLLVEARVRPSDIAFLHPGQKAMVKFTAYDFAIHGGLEAELVHISPDTIMDDKGNSFYLVRVQTDERFMGAEGQPLPIIAGMTVGVDILTGKKTVLDYILKPILKTKQLALRER